MTRTATIGFWSGVALLCGLSAWCVWEWWFIIGQLSIPLDYFVPLARARSKAQFACALLLPSFVLVAIAFFRVQARLSRVQRVLALIGLGLAIAVLLLYVTTPRFRPTA